jgi:hypothetical protein
MHRKLQILNVTAVPQIAPLPGRRYKNGTNPIPISAYMRIPVKWSGDSGDVGQSRSEATLVGFYLI